LGEPSGAADRTLVVGDEIEVERNFTRTRLNICSA
jgi:hypothetical protein